jgi:hypothetical protein
MAPSCELSLLFRFVRENLQHYNPPNTAVNTTNSNKSVSRPPRVAQPTLSNIVQIDLTGDDLPPRLRAGNVRPTIRSSIVLSSDDEDKAPTKTEIVNLLTSDEGEVDEAPVRRRARKSRLRTTSMHQERDGSQPNLTMAGSTAHIDRSIPQESSLIISDREHGASSLFVPRYFSSRSHEHQPQETSPMAKGEPVHSTAERPVRSKPTQQQITSPTASNTDNVPGSVSLGEDHWPLGDNQASKHAGSTDANPSHRELEAAKTPEYTQLPVSFTGSSILTSRSKPSTQQREIRGPAPAKTLPIDKDTQATQGRESRVRTKRSHRQPVPSDNVPIPQVEALGDSTMAKRTGTLAKFPTRPNITASNEADAALRSPSNKGHSLDDAIAMRENNFQSKMKAQNQISVHQDADQRTSMDAESSEGME